MSFPMKGPSLSTTPSLSRRAAVLGGAGVIAGCTSRPERPANTSSAGSPSAGPKPSKEAAVLDDRAFAEALEPARSGQASDLAPGRIYRLSHPVKLDNLVLRGHGATLVVGSGFTPLPGASAVVTVGGQAAVSDLTIRFEAGAPAVDAISWVGKSGGLSVSGVSVRNAGGAGVRCNVPVGRQAGTCTIILDRVGVTGGESGVQIQGATKAVLTDVSVSGSQRNGIALSRGRELTMTRVQAIGCGDHGILLMYWQRGLISACTANSNKGGGITLGGGDPNLVPTRDIDLESCTANGNGLNGISLDTTREGRLTTPVVINSIVRKCTASHNAIHGIAVIASDYVQLRDNTCQHNKDSGVAVSAPIVSMSGNILTANRHWAIGFFNSPRTPAQVRGILAANTTTDNAKGPSNLPVS